MVSLIITIFLYPKKNNSIFPYGMVCMVQEIYTKGTIFPLMDPNPSIVTPSIDSKGISLIIEAILLVFSPTGTKILIIFISNTKIGMDLIKFCLNFKYQCHDFYE